MMENKKIGVILVVLGVVFFIMLVSFNNSLSSKSEEAGCFVSEECKPIEKTLSLTHAGFGFLGFILALGIYLLLFNKTDEKILKKLEDERDKKIEADKFSIIMMALDPYEKKVLKAIKDQDGITQNTLRLRTDMSKAKLSHVLQELEKRSIIKRVPKGKTLQVFLKI